MSQKNDRKHCAPLRPLPRTRACQVQSRVCSQDDHPHPPEPHPALPSREQSKGTAGLSPLRDTPPPSPRPSRRAPTTHPRPGLPTLTAPPHRRVVPPVQRGFPRRCGCVRRQGRAQPCDRGGVGGGTRRGLERRGAHHGEVSRLARGLGRQQVKTPSMNGFNGISSGTRARAVGEGARRCEGGRRGRVGMRTHGL